MENPKNLYVWTYGHEQRWGNAGGRDGAVWRGIKGREKWDNCNSIINKIYLKKKKRSRVSVCQGETARDTERLLEGHCSSRWRAEWTRDSWGKSGVGGSGERTEGTAARIPVLSHSPYCKSCLSQAEHSSPSGISLRGSNRPAHRNYPAPLCGA